jgi:hypothetical protein
MAAFEDGICVDDSHKGKFRESKIFLTLGIDVAVTKRATVPGVSCTRCAGETCT